MNGRGNPCAVIFFGKQAKPVGHYRYRDETARAKSVAQHFESRQSHDKRMSDRRSEDKAFQHDTKVGDIYRTSWGYDQTNVEFFEIIEIRGKFAILREIGCAADESTLGGPQERIIPQSGAFLAPRYEGDDRGQPIRRLIQKHGIKIDDVRTGWKWGKREPITGTVMGAAVSRTGAGWGH
jgi:hypothetical protein